MIISTEKSPFQKKILKNIFDKTYRKILFKRGSDKCLLFFRWQKKHQTFLNPKFEVYKNTSIFLILKNISRSRIYRWSLYNVSCNKSLSVYDDTWQKDYNFIYLVKKFVRFDTFTERWLILSHARRFFRWTKTAMFCNNFCLMWHFWNVYRSFRRCVANWSWVTVSVFSRSRYL